MKILTFGASTSSTSINQQLAEFAAAAASIVDAATVHALRISQYVLPIYSKDEEDANGVPDDAAKFLESIRESDGIVVSLAEHNGSYSAAFKNLYDWASRIEQKVWAGKPMLLMATSPGGRGGATVLAAAEATFPRMGADLAATFSLPSFYEEFDMESGIKSVEHREKFVSAVEKFRDRIEK